MSPGSSRHLMLLLHSGDEGWVRGSVATNTGASTRIQSAPQSLLPGCFSAGKHCGWDTGTELQALATRELPPPFLDLSYVKWSKKRVKF